MIRIILLLLLLANQTYGQDQEKEQIFEFQFAEHTMHGRLNLPETEQPKGIVLIVHGSGRTDAIAGNWHADIRAAINEAGYGTYMWDKMGCGKSEGTFDYNQTVQNSAKEVIVAIRALQQAQIPGSAEIGLWGISRAGWINPLVINQYRDIKFWISVSGVDDKESFNYLFKENLRINGLPQDSITLLVNELKAGARICHEGGSFTAYTQATQNLQKNKFLNRFNNNSVVTEKGYYEYQQSFMKEVLDEETGLQVYVENFDTILANVNCPVLALFGETDRHVDWKKTKLLYQKTLAHNIDLTIKSFPTCNHNLFECETGGFYEFEDNNLPWNRCDGVLAAMTNWLNQQ
ncbi:MAG: alpha/beta hydrolase [Bacteroidota bacterium]